MPKPTDLTQLMTEVRRLLVGMDVFRAWQVAWHRQIHGEEAPLDYGSLVAPGLLLEHLLYPDSYKADYHAWEKDYAEREDMLILSDSQVLFDQINHEDVKPKEARHLLKELKSWYSIMATDLDELSRIGDEDTREALAAFWPHFKANAGFDFHAESGHLLKMANKILKRGNIASDAEWEAMNELLSMVDQSAVPTDMLAKIEPMLNDFPGAT